MDLSFLAPGKVETRGSTQCVGKPLPQCKPSASRRDATSEEKEKLRPKNFNENYKQGYLSNYLSDIRLLRVLVMIGPKNAPAQEKKVTIFGILVYSTHKR